MAEEKPIILAEAKVLACLMRSRDFCSTATQHLKPSYFENPIRHNLAKMSMEYFKKYGSVITLPVFGSELAKLVKTKIIKPEDIPLYSTEATAVFKADISDAPYVMAELVGFIKNREWKKLIEDAVSKWIPKGEFFEIEKMAQHIASIKTSAEVEVLDYFSDSAIDERTERRREESLKPCIGISTGIKRMDDHMPKRGWYIKELYVILAAAKRGKTMALLYFANMAAWQGFNAAYFSCEVSKEVIVDRCDALNTATEIKKVGLPTHLEDIMKNMKAKKPTGKLFVYEYPTKCLTSGEIERQLQIAETKGTRIDIVFVDYGDIMKPMMHYDNPLKEEASIFEDLRAIATKFIVPVITASQVNRDGSDKEIIKGRNVAGSWEKIMVADAIISLSASEQDLKDSVLKIHFAECRNMPTGTYKIKSAFAKGTFYESFIEVVH